MRLLRLIPLLLFISVSPLYANQTKSKIAESLCEYQLDSRVQKFIEYHNAFDNYTYRLKVNQELVIKDRLVRVIAPLGHGGEGDAYLVFGEGSLMVAKIFKQVKNFKRAVEGHQLFKRYLPALLESDSKKKIILLKYEEGVPVDFISMHGHVLDLSDFEIEGIGQEYEDWVKDTYPRHLGHTGLSFWDVNTLYSFKEGTFQLIDPY